MSMMTIHPTLAAGGMKALEDWWTTMNFRAPGASTHAAHSDWLFFWIFAISMFFFVLLMVLMVYFALKYRRRPGRAPERSRSHNTFLELSWSVIPTILLVWMFFEGFWGYADAVVPPAQAPELRVTARMWNWSLEYPNGAVSPLISRTRRMVHSDAKETHLSVQDTPIFVIPADYPVTLRMHSEDVIHSFWVPDFRAKFDVFPNRYTALWFQAKFDPQKALTYQPDPDPAKKEFAYPYEDHWVFCAEYCGQLHSEMYAIMRVVPMDVFQRLMVLWSEPTGAPWERGRALYRIKGCNACHSVDGSRLVGPSWKDMYGHEVELSDGSRVTADDTYIRESILAPAAKIVKGYPNQMQSYQGQLNDEQLGYLIAYMQHLSDKGPPQFPAGEPGEKGGEPAPQQGGGEQPPQHEGQQPPAGVPKRVPPEGQSPPIPAGAPKHQP
jgi:cytochrome c oxidase subunit 2